jgi:nucleoside-diphosphate-sugar epimerase
VTVNRVLVTGASGRLGRATLRLLAAHGVPATGLDQVPVRDAPVDRMVLGDVTDPLAVRDAMLGCNAVAHFAAIPAPLQGLSVRVYGVNTLSAYVVMEEAATAGVRRFVLASSQSILGVSFGREKRIQPLYAPIDAEHPLQCADPYALSKQANEATAEMMHRRHGMDVVALRYPFLGGLDDRLTELGDACRDDPARGMGTLWTYLEDRDAATVAWLALTVPLSGYHMFNVAAPETFAPQPTEELLARFYPGTEIRSPIPGRTTPVDTSPVASTLGFTPEFHYS